MRSAVICGAMILHLASAALPGASTPQRADRSAEYPVLDTTAYCGWQIEEFSEGDEIFHRLVAGEGCVLWVEFDYGPSAGDGNLLKKMWVEVPAGAELEVEIASRQVFVVEERDSLLMRPPQDERHGATSLKVVSRERRALVAEIRWEDRYRRTVEFRSSDPPGDWLISLSGLAPVITPPSVREPSRAETVKLTSGTAYDAERFGTTVAISNDTAVIGGVLGGPQVFVRNGDGWVQRARLARTEVAPETTLGGPVAISGDTILVAGARDGMSWSREVYVFVRSGDAWRYEAALTADGDEAQGFGNSVSVSGDTAVVGAPSFTDHNGVAYVFTRGEDSWSRQAKLTLGDEAPPEGFGEKVSIDGDTVLVSAKSADGRGFDAGAVYVFVRRAGSWSRQAKLSASDGESNDFLGYSVAVSGDTAVVGAPGDDGRAGAIEGCAYVFVRDGESWSTQVKLTPTSVDDNVFGFAVAVDGDQVVVGTGNGTSVYLFTRSDGIWAREVRLVSGDSEVEDGFGEDIAISGKTALVGAYGRGRAGAAYVFDTGPRAGTAGGR